MSGISGIGGFLNSTVNGAVGSAQGKSGTTVQTFLISLAAGFILFAVQFGIFLLVRNYLWAKRIYQPRSFLVPVKSRIKPPNPNPFKWVWTVWKIQEDPDLLEKAGMDAYFFLRYLSMCLKIFTPMAILIMPILIPLNIKGGKNSNFIAGTQYNVTGLDRLAWSNVSPTNTNRYWAHLFFGVGVVVWACFMFHQELLHYIAKRQKYLSSVSHRLKASATTVLIQDIPKDLCTEEALAAEYDDFPGGIRRIWLNRDFSPLVDKDELRKDYEDRLENAETDLLRVIAKRSRKAKSKEALEAQAGEGGSSIPRPEMGPATPESCQRDLEYDIETKALWTKFIKPKERETMRVSQEGDAFAAKIPLIGRFFKAKVDTIYYCRRELARLNREIEMDAKTPGAYSLNRSAFVQFNSQKAAHLACQSIASLDPNRMRRRTIEISPGDINWPALNHSWRSQYFRLALFFLFFGLLLFTYGMISVFTGILSKISTLADSTSWLRWIGSLPNWLLSFVQGTLPPFITILVLSGPLPILIRMLTNKMRGSVTGTEGELRLQTWYFVFLVFELFLIPTISSGLTSIVQELLNNPTSVPNLLATNLPTAANYYFSFLIVQALSLSASSMLQTIRLLNFYVFGHANTPDSVFQKLSSTNMTRIGSNIPWYTTFAVIGLVYSVIAPLMLLFMLITFSLFWCVIKNNLLYCVRTGPVDGGGLFFPHAIQQLFTGLYFLEVSLIGLFLLVRDDNAKVACGAQGIIMAIVLVFTVLYQYWLMTHLWPLFKYAPIQLEAQSNALLDDFHKRCSIGNRDFTNAAETSNSVSQVNNKLGLDGITISQEDDKRPTGTPTLVNEPVRPPFASRPSSHRSGHAQQQADAEFAQRILDRLNRPLDEARLEHLERKISKRNTEKAGHEKTGHGKTSHDKTSHEKPLITALIPHRRDIEAQMLDDPISKIIMQHNDELEDLTAEERDMLISVAFMHPVLRETKPSVWIPKDDAGVSDDEVRRTRELSGDVVIDNRGAFFDSKGKMRVAMAPPDMSEFALIMAEL